MNNQSMLGENKLRGDQSAKQERGSVHQPLPCAQVSLEQVVHSLIAAESYVPSRHRVHRPS